MTRPTLLLLAALATAVPVGAQGPASEGSGEGIASPDAVPGSTEGPQIQIGAGVPGILDDARGAMGMLSVRFGSGLLGVRPLAGLLGASQGQLFVFGGVFRDVALGRWVVTPMLSGGAYEKGHGRDLGSRLQFRSAMEVSWRFQGGQRVGVQVAHISNAGLGWRNPGQERLLVTFTRPF
ncbi:MAG TPA: acyloxyacyl hydrolase [Longimicrobiales bacterium]|nr:acyloxyacyl hydrolase [Longimicrobiales bacterium]